MSFIFPIGQSADNAVTFSALIGLKQILRIAAKGYILMALEGHCSIGSGLFAVYSISIIILGSGSVIDGKQPESKDYKIIEAAWGPVSEDKAYLEAHIPGAVHMNTDDIEESTYWNIKTGDEIKKVMSDYGITKDTAVIVYGDDSGADRVAFVCLWAGVENVKVLDGGLAEWTKAGYETNKDMENPQPTTADFGVAIPAHPLPVNIYNIPHHSHIFHGKPLNSEGCKQ